jgi:hypothetical protein
MDSEILYYRNLTDQYSREIDHLNTDFTQIKEEKDLNTSTLNTTLRDLHSQNTEILVQQDLQAQKIRELSSTCLQAQNENVVLANKNRELNAHVQRLVGLNKQLEHKNYSISSAVQWDIQARAREYKGRTLSALHSSSAHKVLHQMKEELNKDEAFSFRAQPPPSYKTRSQNINQQNSFRRSNQQDLQDVNNIVIKSPMGRVLNDDIKKRSHTDDRFNKLITPQNDFSRILSSNKPQNLSNMNLSNIKEVQDFDIKEFYDKVDKLNESDDITIFDSIQKSPLKQKG